MADRTAREIDPNIGQRNVAVDHLHVETTSFDSPPSLAQASTTLTLATAFSNNDKATPEATTTPENQSVKSKMTKIEREARDFMKTKGLDIAYDDLDHEGKLRANRLVSADFFSSWSPTKEAHGCVTRGETSFHEQWEEFYGHIANHETLSLLFCDGFIYESLCFDPAAIERHLVIRNQKAGSCYMHAVAVFQHYLWCSRRQPEEENHATLDIYWYIREKFSKEKLERFVTNGGGHSALEFYCEITGANPDAIETASWWLQRKSLHEDAFHWYLDIICRLFQRSKEPVLVSNFWIEPDFQTANKFVYDGEVDRQVYEDYGKECNKPDREHVLHSMVMLGLKEDPSSGKVWFLLQNFWEDKYLVVASGEYLASCGARFTFVPDFEPVDLQEDFPICVDDQYMETEIGPEEETYCPEVEETGWFPEWNSLEGDY